MTSRDFCYWLQGYFEITEELNDGRGLGASQTKMIRRHFMANHLSAAIARSAAKPDVDGDMI